MFLETPRLILRPWTDEDAEDLFRYASHPAVGPIAGWPVHKSVEESREIIASVLSAPETYAVVPRAAGHAAGAASLTAGPRSNLALPEDEAEIGYWIGVPFWGQGLIPEAVQALIRRGFAELGYRRLWCGYFEGNERSRRVQEKCGFRFHHTNRDIHWALMDDIRTEHVTCLTVEEWQAQK